MQSGNFEKKQLAAVRLIQDAFRARQSWKKLNVVRQRRSTIINRRSSMTSAVIPSLDSVSEMPGGLGGEGGGSAEKKEGGSIVEQPPRHTPRPGRRSSHHDRRHRASADVMSGTMDGGGGGGDEKGENAGTEVSSEGGSAVPVRTPTIMEMDHFLSQHPVSRASLARAAAATAAGATAADAADAAAAAAAAAAAKTAAAAAAAVASNGPGPGKGAIRRAKAIKPTGAVENFRLLNKVLPPLEGEHGAIDNTRAENYRFTKENIALRLEVKDLTAKVKDSARVKVRVGEVMSELRQAEEKLGRTQCFVAQLREQRRRVVAEIRELEEAHQLDVEITTDIDAETTAVARMEEMLEAMRIESAKRLAAKAEKAEKARIAVAKKEKLQLANAFLEAEERAREEEQRLAKVLLEKARADAAEHAAKVAEAAKAEAEAEAEARRDMEEQARRAAEQARIEAEREAEREAVREAEREVEREIERVAKEAARVAAEEDAERERKKDEELKNRVLRAEEEAAAIVAKEKADLKRAEEKAATENQAKSPVMVLPCQGLSIPVDPDERTSALQVRVMLLSKCRTMPRRRRGGCNDSFRILYASSSFSLPFFSLVASLYIYIVVSL